MTQSVTSPPTLALVSTPARVNVPAIPSWATGRPHIADRLDVGMSGVLTVVTGPPGAGKSMAVASWAADADVSVGLVWLSLAGLGADPDCFWHFLRQGLNEAGAPGLVRIPPIGSAGSRRNRLLAEFGTTLGATGPWVVVLDDYPTRQRGPLENDLQTVLDHARRGIRLVVLSRSDPPLSLHRHAAAGELTRVVGSDLDMGTREVAQVLRAHGVEDLPATVRTVERHTTGWACGVHLAAAALQTAPTIEEAMHEADRSIVEFLSHEVLSEVATPVRDLIVRTSITEVVEPELARAVLGPAGEVTFDTSFARSHFIDLQQDGSFRCHPLLRAAAQARLSLERPDVARAARRAAARLYAGRGDTRTSIELAMAAGDWALVASTIVGSCAAPQVIVGAANAVVESALRVTAVKEAEPVLLAADALARRNVAAAELALAGMEEIPVDGAASSQASRLSARLARLTIGRLTSDPAKVEEVTTDARRILAELPIAEDLHDEIAGMLEAQSGALLMCAGDLHGACVALARGAQTSPVSRASRVARDDCGGQLALAEALQGNLRQASQHAGSLLAENAGRGERTPTGQAGIIQAHLAMACVNIDRCELEAARTHLELAGGRCENPEPFLAAVHLLLQARLLIGGDEPEAALRLLAPAVGSARWRARLRWMDELLAETSAEAAMSMGEPGQALALVRAHAPCPGVEARLVTASALSELGDGDGARSALAAIVGEVAGAPVGTQVRCWLLEARFAAEDGHVERAWRLVDRALRVATCDVLRRPFMAESAWLHRFVAGEVVLRRMHGGFLASVLPAQRLCSATQSGWAEGDLLVESLTVREAQVLGLLAEMCSTDEIARELFLSVNTIKTYVRGILRKLCVNRRVDAVRRGRELGLC